MGTSFNPAAARTGSTSRVLVTALIGAALILAGCSNSSSAPPKKRSAQRTTTTAPGSSTTLAAVGPAGSTTSTSSTTTTTTTRPGVTTVTVTATTRPGVTTTTAPRATTTTMATTTTTAPTTTTTLPNLQITAVTVTPTDTCTNNPLNGNYDCPMTATFTTNHGKAGTVTWTLSGTAAVGCSSASSTPGPSYTTPVGAGAGSVTSVSESAVFSYDPNGSGGTHKSTMVVAVTGPNTISSPATNFYDSTDSTIC